MKNVIKKVAAVAMAFTLLGTGSAVTKTINPKFDTAITASAAYCNHVVGSSSYGAWEDESKITYRGVCKYVDKRQPVKCVKCKKTLWYRHEEKCYQYYDTYSNSGKHFTGYGLIGTRYYTSTK